MEKIFSKVDPAVLLHVIYSKRDFQAKRFDIIDPDNFIQCSSLKLNFGDTFKPHHHIWKRDQKRDVIAQESWIVIEGMVKCIFYDLDNSILGVFYLYPGDASFTLEGGHNYKAMTNDTLVYEYKTGPYQGQKMDKKFIS
jgi:hypothetical protein